jgi:soluble P-type ATPase
VGQDRPPAARLDGALTVFVSADREPAGALLLEDKIRPDARQTIRAIRHGGITRIVLATGDRAEAADAVGALTGVDEVLAGLTPAGNLDAVRREQRRAPVIMTGDEINDAPALALADVGIAMGARGSTASSEAADAVLTVDQLGRLGDVAALARRTRRIALQSVLAGMGMSLAAMGVAAAGLLPAVWGALLQEGIDVAVILNALRALRPPAPAVRMTAAHTALTRRFRAEHQAIRADIDQLRTAADTLDAPGAMTRVRQVYGTLIREVWPHESAEEAELYPSLNQVLGGADPTAPMSRAHAEIAYRIARLGRLIDDIGDRDPDLPRLPTSAASCTGCMPSSGCTPSRRTKPTCHSATPQTPCPPDLAVGRYSPRDAGQSRHGGHRQASRAALGLAHCLTGVTRHVWRCAVKPGICECPRRILSCRLADRLLGSAVAVAGQARA